MQSLAFPNMFGNTTTKVFTDHQATASNLKLTLMSEKTSLFGDPYFGTNIKKMLYEQNNYVLQDLVIDDIYTAILQFMPQLVVQRKDIQLVSQGEDVYITIKALNLIDYTVDTYNINLLNYEVV